MKTALVALAMLAGFALPCHAAGINLSWDDCGAAGGANKTFACDVNTGASFVLVGSFSAPDGSTAITGTEVAVDISSVTAELPNWWQFFAGEACRRTSLSASADFVSFPYAACQDLWAAQAIGAVAAYIHPYGSLRCRSRLIAFFAWPQEYWAPVESGVEYYAFRIAIARDKTVGSSACAGCLAPVALVLNEIKLTQPTGVGNFRIQNPSERNYVSWQGGDPWQSCLFVPARNSTWGAIKAQYR